MDTKGVTFAEKKGVNVLVTGGTGSFGKHYIKTILAQDVKKVIVFSRDEFKQSQMEKDPRLRFFIGDVRDLERLRRAFVDVDVVIHAAALKQVPAMEYNPTEAVKTNIEGSKNVIEAAIDRGVKKVIGISTDKAVNPINLYGATKLVMEKMFMAANAYSGHKTKFSCVRYGNVIGSRGSVIPFFEKLKERGIKRYPITHLEMTRFWITLDQAVQLVLIAEKEMQGAEIFVPLIPSCKITDLARAIDPTCEFEVTGIRPGEKLHELLVGEDRNNVYIVSLYSERYKLAKKIISSENTMDLKSYWEEILEKKDVYI